MSEETTAKTWQTKRIDAINRKIINSSNARALTEAYMCEYERVIESTCKTKKEYKEWTRENGKV
tara:strand:+ start:1349 stop:1540 length:192 start_codon:yes stop_codon:yes gene_type:complete